VAVTILVVDDSSSMRAVIRIALSRAGYEILEADDGATAVQMLDGRRIDLIVSDVNMPIMDGLTLIGQLRHNKTHRFTPVIMITTESSAEIRMQGKSLGVNVWIIKPFKPDQLLSAITLLTCSRV
jgi:two-component system chemotaxis response regulator CheY